MGIKLKELKEFLNTLPEHMDEFEMVNGEVSPLTDTGYYARVDKLYIARCNFPVCHIQVCRL